MTSFTTSHWGIYEVERNNAGQPAIKSFRDDPDSCPIGRHQLDESLMRLRIRRPAIRRSCYEAGPGARPELRGREPFVEVPWDEALDLVAAELDQTRKTSGNRAIFGGSYGWSSAGRFHHAQSQIHRFLNTIGGYVAHRDSYSLGAARVLMPHIVASMDWLMMEHTSFDVLSASTELFISFGGVPAKNAQIAAGGAGRHRVKAALQDMARKGVKFVNVSPVRDNFETGSEVEWIAIRPNTDTAFMLALAWVLVKEGRVDHAFLQRCTVGYGEIEKYILGATDGIAKTPRWAEAITGVPASRIESLARDIATKRTMLNIVWALQRATHGEQPYWMLLTLAAMAGQIGLPGGGFGVGYGCENTLGSSHKRLRAAAFDQKRNPVADFIPVARITDMLLNPGAPFEYNGGSYRYPAIELVYWAGGNPFHHHQDINRLVKAWQVPRTVVVHEQFWNPLAKMADIVLPATTSMERNDIGHASREGYLVAMKKFIDPVGEALDDYEIFSRLSSRLGAHEAFTEGRDEMGWLRHLYGMTVENWGKMGVPLPDFDTFWNGDILDLTTFDEPVIMLKDFVDDPEGKPLDTPSGKIELFSSTIAAMNLRDCPGHATWIEPAEWLGRDDKTFPLHLLSDQPRTRLHSQLDASGFSLDGKLNGLEPTYISEADAEKRGIVTGDVIEIFNARGSCLSAAQVSADIMPGVVRLATGAWYTPDWETLLDVHGNPNVLTLDVGSSLLSQGCSAQTCLVEVRRADWRDNRDLSKVRPFALPELEPAPAR